MKNRCLNPRSTQYAWYGGKGISVCQRWLSFENFFADMGERPEGTTLDRKDSRGNYEPGNCRWLEAEKQQDNRTNSRVLVIEGVKMTLPAAARQYGISQKNLRNRIDLLGYSHDEAVMKPVGAQGRRSSTKRVKAA